MVKDELLVKLEEIIGMVIRIYPKVEEQIKNYEQLIVHSITGNEVELLKINIIKALETIKGSERTAIAIGKKEDLDEVVDIAMAQIHEIDELEADLNKVEKQPTKELFDAIENLRIALEKHIKLAPKALKK